MNYELKNGKILSVEMDHLSKTKSILKFEKENGEIGRWNPGLFPIDINEDEVKGKYLHISGIFDSNKGGNINMKITNEPI